MIVAAGVQFVILQATDGPIHFQHRQRDVVIAVDAVLSQGALEFVHADVFFSHVWSYDLPVMDQKAGLAFDDFAKAPVDSGELGYPVVHDEKSHRGSDSA